MMYQKTSRRAFVKQFAVGAIGFPLVVRACALGKDGGFAPSQQLLVAQIGCGAMGMGDLRALLNVSRQVRITAVCDVDDRRSQEAKKVVDDFYGNTDCRVYRDFRQLLEKESLDIASIAVPDHWHAIVSISCARKRLDIYGQKPLARTIGEGRLICDAVKRYGIIWQTGSWQRSVRNFYQACMLVRNGRIGKVEYVEVGLPDGPTRNQIKLLDVPPYLDWDLWLGPAPWRPYQDFGSGGCHWDWRWIMDYSGGQLTDWAGHHIDIAHWGLGMDYEGPIEIEGKGEYPTEGPWDAPFAYDFTAKYANGLTMRVANASKLPHGLGTCWYGSKGWIFVTRGPSQASDPKILQERIGPDEIQLYKSEDHHKNFLECVLTRKHTISPAEIAHRSLSVGLLGEIAMLLGRKLRWDPKAERFINDDTANGMLMRAYRKPWAVV